MASGEQRVFWGWGLTPMWGGDGLRLGGKPGPVRAGGAVRGRWRQSPGATVPGGQWRAGLGGRLSCLGGARFLNCRRK